MTEEERDRYLHHQEGTSGALNGESRRRMDAIDTKIDQLFNMIAKLAVNGTQPANPPPQVVDPQIAELEAMAQHQHTPRAAGG